jgi:Fe-S oxidoreductase
LIGIHPERQMPVFARETFTSWHQKQDFPHQDELTKGVVFFFDTYLEYNYPHIGQAVVKIFQKAGIDLIVLREKADSGRPAYSKGVLKKARKLAQINLKLLEPYAEKGIPIIACEPTVVVMLKKEYRDLVPGAGSDQVANSTVLVEDYLLQEINTGNISFSYDQKPRRILYHGHCQQKAHLGTGNTLSMLNNLPNCVGYEKEHYQLSLDIAELGLAPRIREAAPDTIICASGTSCREQIVHTTQRKAIHPLEVFAESLA